MTPQERIVACESFRVNVLRAKIRSETKLASIREQIALLGTVPTLAKLRTFLTMLREILEDAA